MQNIDVSLYVYMYIYVHMYVVTFFYWRHQIISRVSHDTEMHPQGFVSV